MSTTPDPITQIETIVLRIPFDDGGKGHGIMPTRWNALDIMMLRVETASGLVGWGEGFGYLCQHVTARAVQDMITPFAMGRDSRDPAQVNRDAQLALHLFGRFGITMFAISALDIALWDIAAKRENLSLGRLLGGRTRDAVQAYASLVRYGTPELVRHFTGKAIREGYTSIKLHEVDEACIAAARAAAPEAEITVDANCQIPIEKALAMADFLKEQHKPVAALAQLLPEARADQSGRSRDGDQAVLCPAHMACPSRSVFSWEHHGRGPTKTIAARRTFLFMRLCCGQCRGIEPPPGHAMNNTSYNCVGKGLFFRQFLRLIKM